MKNWTVRDIAIWQENTFNPSIKSQTMKGKYEAREYFKASRRGKRGELIDYFITKCWLAHFKREPNAQMVIEIIKMLPDWEDIQKGINLKMKINLKRTWVNVKGEWRHVEQIQEND
jgi:hypothetical protein